MIPPSALRKSVSILFAGLAAAQLSADTVEIKNGARILGKITQIDVGSIIVNTDYAGTIIIKQSEVSSISTDAPIAVRLASGTRFDGKVTGGAGGAIQIAGVDGTITTTVDKVAASWPSGAKDPAMQALERHWAYEAAVDIAGKSGNKNQLGTAASVRATLKTAQDTLQFYAAYDRQVTESAKLANGPDGIAGNKDDGTAGPDTKSADQFKAGVDYQNNFRGKSSWYVRDEGGFDRVKDIELYNVAAAGFGYDFIKEANHILTGRAGLSYRYEGYKNPLTPDVKSAGLDFGLAHSLTLKNSKLVNRLSYVPAFDDFGNYKFNQESFYEIPLLGPKWKLRLGVSNDYNSQPGQGVDKLDTTYFTRFVLNWQ